MNGTDTRETADELLGSLRLFWPGAEVDDTPDRKVRRSLGERAVYAVGPGASRTRMLVPVEPRGAAERTWCRFSAASTVQDTGARLALAAATRLAPRRVLSGRVVVRGGSEDTLARHLGGVLGQQVTFSLGIGTPRVNRKPVLQVFDERGRTVAFVKVGDTPTSSVDVRAEAGHLRDLGARDWAVLSLPRVIDVSLWRGLAVLVLSALPTSPWQRGGHRPQPPVAAMHELADSGRTGGGPDGGALHELPWLATQRRTATGLADTAARDRLLDCFDLLLDRAASCHWRTGAWHGDWTPWNMARSGRRVHLWDWERYETGVPLGLDRCHFIVNAHTRRHGTTISTLEDAVHRALQDAAAAGPTALLTAATYLTAVSVRYLSLAETQRGSDIVDRGHATLGVLERVLSGGRQFGQSVE